MQKTKNYRNTRFTAEVITEAAQALRALVPKATKENTRLYLSVMVDEAQWHHDSEEEFLADYRRSSRGAAYQLEIRPYGLRLQAFHDETEVGVEAPHRREIEAIFAVFERHAAACRIPDTAGKAEEPEVAVFIGHGASDLWRDLKDHLHEKHGYKVVAYEIGARAGHTIRDVLEEMLEESSFAILVMTGEDATAEGRLHPRLNVVHEAGLFQGRIGFNRAIVLLEEGTEEFSNIQGLQQIRFASGNIKEVFGEVLATLRREFD